MGAGLAGSSVYGTNVNQIQFGDRLQGLSPKATQFFIQSGRGGGNNYRTRTVAPKRDFIFCMNQLSGVGASRSPYKIRGLNNPRGTGHCRPGKYYPAGYRVSEVEMRAHGSMDDPRMEFWLVYGGIVYSTGTSADPFWVAHGSSLSGMPSSIDQTDVYASGVVSAEDLLAAIVAPGSHGMSGGAYAKMLAELAVIGTYDGALVPMPSMPGAIVTREAVLGDDDFLWTEEQFQTMQTHRNTNPEIIQAIADIKAYFSDGTKFPVKFMEEHQLILVGDKETIQDDLAKDDAATRKRTGGGDQTTDLITERKEKAKKIKGSFLHLAPISDELRAKGGSNVKYQELTAYMEAGDEESARILTLVNMVNYHSSRPDARGDNGDFQPFNYSDPTNDYYNGLNGDVGVHVLGFLKSSTEDDGGVRALLQEEDYGESTWYGLEVYSNVLIVYFWLNSLVWKVKFCKTCSITGTRQWGDIFLKSCKNTACSKGETYYDDTFQWFISSANIYKFAYESACAMAESVLGTYVVSPVMSVISTMIDYIEDEFGWSISKSTIKGYIEDYLTDAIGC